MKITSRTVFRPRKFATRSVDIQNIYLWSISFLSISLESVCKPSDLVMVPENLLVF